ncbi:MAG: translation initiation factor IF-3 [Bacteroidota bacterium]|nr:translation initiation factor IF-3 [Bacteroidota bacterium]MDP4237355.1 translation initiation factor IF-3 [Bacteroidota bacterium]
MGKQIVLRPTAPSAPKPPSGRQNRFSREMPVKNAGVRMNEQIRVPMIRVVDEEGVVGVMTPQDAMKLAHERGVDLLEIAPTADPPVCKLMEFGKWRYEQQKREKTAKASSHKQLIKELRFHPSTDTHDFEFKLRHARTWIEEGHKVKVTVQFKGREIAYKEHGVELLKKFEGRITDIAKIDSNISLMGKLMTMMFSPKGKGKKDEEPVAGGYESKPKPKSEFAEKLEAMTLQKKIKPDEAAEAPPAEA